MQRNPLTAEKTKDIRILKNIKQGATAPQTTAQSAVAFMNVDSLRSLIEEVLHGFFKKQNINPTNLPLSTGRSVSSAVLDAVTGISPNPIEIPPKATNLLQLNISGGKTAPQNLQNTTLPIFRYLSKENLAHSVKFQVFLTDYALHKIIVNVLDKRYTELFMMILF